jgi:hypothetical protein
MIVSLLLFGAGVVRTAYKNSRQLGALYSHTCLFLYSPSSFLIFCISFRSLVNYQPAVRASTTSNISMMSHIRGLKDPNDDELESIAGSLASFAPGTLGNPKDGAIIYVPPTLAKEKKHQSPQDAIDEFWEKFNSKTPGRGV